MNLPEKIVCVLCGVEARVLTDSIDESEVDGKLTSAESPLEQSVWITVDCPNCGWQQQAVAPR